MSFPSDLITNERATGRPQDLADLAKLWRVRDQLRKQSARRDRAQIDRAGDRSSAFAPMSLDGDTVADTAVVRTMAIDGVHR